MSEISALPAENRKRWAMVLIHCAVGLLVFIMPEVIITYLQPQRPGRFYLSMYARTIGILIVFYINYLWIIPPTLNRKPRKIGLFVACETTLTLIFLGVMLLIMMHMPHRHHPLQQDTASFFSALPDEDTTHAGARLHHHRARART